MSCGCTKNTSCGRCSNCNKPTCPAANCPEVCTSIIVGNSWNVPDCGEKAVLSVPGLKSVLIGSYLFNPSYGQFKITAFDSLNSLVTVLNECLAGNAPAGTVVPALTQFILSAIPNTGQTVIVLNTESFPTCGNTVNLTVVALSNVPFGSYIWNPLYGYFRIVNYNASNSTLTVQNDCLCPPGTGPNIDGGSVFIFVDPPYSDNFSAGQDWQIPNCGATVNINAPLLSDVVIGSYIFNPAFGHFLVTAYSGGVLTVQNTCLAGNVAGGTNVPACSSFIFVDEPTNQQDDGWTQALADVTFVDANTFTVPGDWTDLVERGDKIKITDGTVKFFGVIATSFGAGVTTFLVYAGDDYTLSGGALSDLFYSHEDSPVLFPRYFNWTPTVDALAPMTAALDSVEQARLHFVGKNVVFDVTVSVTLAGVATSVAYINFPLLLLIEGENSASANFPCQLSDAGVGGLGLYRSTPSPAAGLIITKTGGANYTLGAVTLAVSGHSPLA